jgi:hypothetical protein
MGLEFECKPNQTWSLSPVMNSKDRASKKGAVECEMVYITFCFIAMIVIIIIFTSTFIANIYSYNDYVYILSIIMILSLSVFSLLCYHYRDNLPAVILHDQDWTDSSEQVHAQSVVHSVE